MASNGTANRIRVLALKKKFGEVTPAEEKEFARLKDQLRQTRLQESKERK